MMSNDDDASAIRQLIEEWAAAVRRRDMNGILRHHADDFIMFDVPPPFESRGIEAYERTWILFFATSLSVPVFDISRLDVVAGTDVAFAIAHMRCVYLEKGRPTDLDFRLTIGFRKVDGRRTSIHEHHSIPAVEVND